MKHKIKGFFLIEMLLAIGILGGAAMIFLIILIDSLSKMKGTEKIKDFYDIKSEIIIYIQSHSFDEIYLQAQRNHSLFFNEKNEKNSIKVKLNLNSKKKLETSYSENYPKSYFPIYIEFFGNNEKNITNSEIITSFIMIKNR